MTITELDITDSSNKNHRRTWSQKLSRDMQMRVCVDLAFDIPVTTIVKNIRTDYGIEIAPQTIYQGYLYSEKWQKHIRFFRDRWRKSLSFRPCMSKSWRLKHLETQFLKATEANDYSGVARLHSQILDEVIGRRSTNINIKQENNNSQKTSIFQDLTPKSVDKMTFAERIKVINDRLSLQRQ